MKKALSLFLAILMIFSVFTVSTFAEGTDTQDEGSTTPTSAVQTPLQMSLAEQQAYLKSHALMSDKDMTFIFYIDRGTYFQAQKVFDYGTNKFVYKTPDEMKNIDPYIMFPDPAGFQEPGAMIQLPFVTAPAGWNFTGWYCVEDATPYAAGYGFEIPTTYKNQKNADGTAKSTAGGTYTFKAMYNPAEVEEDTFAKVFEILAKIFGTIIGLIAYEGDTAAGIAFVRRIFGGITG